MKSYIAAKPFVWIQGESGAGYICAVEDIEGRENLREEELRALCLDDSERPWND